VPTAKEAQIELALRATKKSFGSFFRAYPPGDDYKYGRHTVGLIHQAQKTSTSLRAGRCRYICVCLPPRHGKSDIISRRFPVWYLIGSPDDEVILASYNHQLATDMSFVCRDLFSELAPLYGLSIHGARHATDRWYIADHKGAMYAAGLGGTITGRGAHLMVIDDYLKNREDAESKLMRDKGWDSFESDLMTRLAPVHAVMIVANRWHDDDLVGRIKKKNTPNDRSYDPDFPIFEMIEYPAWTKKGGWLFPERFSDQWYRSTRAMMGAYAWQAQGLQNPTPRVGAIFDSSRVEIVDEMPEDLPWIRGWDLASSEKERMKEDPDFSVGAKVAWNGASLYVDDIIRGQWEAPERNRKIVQTAKRDGRDIVVKVEVVAGYKDAYTTLKGILKGKSIVRQVTVSRDLVSRASCLEPSFDAGKIFIKRGPWNQDFLTEFGSFTGSGSAHDDQVAAVVTAIKDEIDRGGRIIAQRI